MPERRTARRRVTAAVVVTATLGVLVWAGSQVWQARQQAMALERVIAATTQHASGMDMPALVLDLRELRDRSAALQSSTSGPLWEVASWIPWVGDDVDAVQRTARGVSTVAQSTTGLDAILPGLAPSMLRGPGGRIDVAKLQAAAPELARVRDALAAARSDLSGINTQDLLGPVAGAVSEAQTALTSAPESVDALAALPALLGADRHRTYGVLLLNPAELRGGGGFFGGYALVTADHGDITLARVGPSDDLVTSGQLEVSSLPKEYRALWGESALEWQSVNISPNYPYVGQLTQEGFAKLGIHVDGVIALDSKVATALLAGTGPVTANGVTISSRSADAYFTKAIYAQFPDGVGHKAQALALFAQLFEKLTTGTLDMRAMTSALVPLLDQRRLLFWASDARVEAPFTALPAGGVVPDSAGPWTTVALVNGSGNKMDAYVRSHVSYLSNRCTASTEPSTVTVRLANLAPAVLPPYVDQRLDDPAAPKGSTMSLAYVYGPLGSTLVTATLDGRTVPVQAGLERGHPVWRFDVALLRGQARSLVVAIAEPHDGSTAAPTVMAQPMAIDETTAATASECG